MSAGIHPDRLAYIQQPDDPPAASSIIISASDPPPVVGDIYVENANPDPTSVAAASSILVPAHPPAPQRRSNRKRAKAPLHPQNAAFAAATGLTGSKRLSRARPAQLQLLHYSQPGAQGRKQSLPTPGSGKSASFQFAGPAPKRKHSQQSASAGAAIGISNPVPPFHIPGLTSTTSTTSTPTSAFFGPTTPITPFGPSFVFGQAGPGTAYGQGTYKAPPPPLPSASPYLPLQKQEQPFGLFPGFPPMPTMPIQPAQTVFAPPHNGAQMMQPQGSEVCAPFSDAHAAHMCRARHGRCPLTMIEAGTHPHAASCRYGSQAALAVRPSSEQASSIPRTPRSGHLAACSCMSLCDVVKLMA